MTEPEPTKQERVAHLYSHLLKSILRHPEDRYAEDREIVARAVRERADEVWEMIE